MSEAAPALLPEEIRHATLVRASAERVYDALTTEEGLDGWFTRGAEVDARPGGEIRFRWERWGPDRITDEDGGAVLAASRPKRFVFQWRPDRAGPPTTVEIELEHAGEGTIVRLRERGYTDTAAGREQQLECACGWGEALTLLKFFVEHGLRY